MRTARLLRVAQMSLEKSFYLLPIGLSGGTNNRWGLAAAAGRKNRRVGSCKAGALRPPLENVFFSPLFYGYVNAKRGIDFISSS